MDNILELIGSYFSISFLPWQLLRLKPCLAYLIMKKIERISNRYFLGGGDFAKYWGLININYLLRFWAENTGLYWQLSPD